MRLSYPSNAPIPSWGCIEVLALRSTIAFLIFCGATAAIAKDRFMSALPTHNVFPTPSGIIFPSLLTAAGVNPAALPQRGKTVKALGVNYSPPPSGTSDHQYSIAFAGGDKGMGLGGGIIGQAGENFQNGLYLGGGFRSESTSIGIGLRDGNVNDGFKPETDLGIIANGVSEIAIGLVLYRLESAPQIDFGIGFGKDKSYNFEVNVLMPPVSTAFAAGAAYTITAATTVYAGRFGLSFTSSYTTTPAEVNQGVSLMIFLFKNIGLTLQYRSPNRSYWGLIATF